MVFGVGVELQMLKLKPYSLAHPIRSTLKQKSSRS